MGSLGGPARDLKALGLTLNVEVNGRPKRWKGQPTAFAHKTPVTHINTCYCPRDSWAGLRSDLHRVAGTGSRPQKSKLNLSRGQEDLRTSYRAQDGEDYLC